MSGRYEPRASDAGRFIALTFGTSWMLWAPLLIYGTELPGGQALGFAGSFGSLVAAAILGVYFLTVPGVAVVLAWLYNATGGSVLVCVIAHAALNTAFVVHPTDGLTSQLILLASVWGLALAAMAVGGPRALGSRAPLVPSADPAATPGQ